MLEARPILRGEQIANRYVRHRLKRVLRTVDFLNIIEEEEIFLIYKLSMVVFYFVPQIKLGVCVC